VSALSDALGSRLRGEGWNEHLSRALMG